METISRSFHTSSTRWNLSEKDISQWHFQWRQMRLIRRGKTPSKTWNSASIQHMQIPQTSIAYNIAKRRALGLANELFLPWLRWMFLLAVRQVWFADELRFKKQNVEDFVQGEESIWLAEDWSSSHLSTPGCINNEVCIEEAQPSVEFVLKSKWVPNIGISKLFDTTVLYGMEGVVWYRSMEWLLYGTIIP